MHHSTRIYVGSFLLMMILVLGGPLSIGLAQVRVSALFSDHMILQRDRPIVVWGWGTPGEDVLISLADQTANTQVAQDGRWTCTLKPLPASANPIELKIQATNEILLKDILVGDVWLCSGQSNMEWGLGGCDAPEDIQSANFPLIRHFGVEANFAASPQANVKGRWNVCKPETAPGFTAVGFYFARRVHQETGVPIGLLRSSVGGTNIECWMSQETLMNTPALQTYAKMMRDSLAQYQNDLQAIIPEVEAWTKQSRDALSSGAQVPMPPAIPEFPFGEKMFRPRCVTLHNGMIHPLKSFALKGVLWYQGENNAGSPADGLQYIEKKRAMINDWRQWFGDPDLPFYFVQLAAWQKTTNDPGLADGWAFFRDAQRQCLSLPHTGMAVAIDIGDADDIHPKNKYDVGQRLARWALANEYSKPIEVSGPLFRSLKIDGNKATIDFDHVGSGLAAGSKTGRNPVEFSESTPLRRFAIAGQDRKWYWAEARIEGNRVVCSHPSVPEPIAIRYAFSMNPQGANLYNRDGLPASPFRTDDW
jgi:sialate O-acetylesterase